MLCTLCSSIAVDVTVKAVEPMLRDAPLCLAAAVFARALGKFKST